ncbi:MAG TPA: ATP-binding protein [Ktedonosporobacter sp.]|nr:ATP-binding protein [Ktedonosporobacter sp.]
MRSIKNMPLPGVREEETWKRYTIDTVLAAVGALLVTAIISVFHLYPTIPNISLLYLPVVLGLASTRGRYAAIGTSVVAFISFDFFLVPPLYTFTINRPEEWLALLVFMATAIITGQLAAAMRWRAEQATQREGETRALYELVSATTGEVKLESQLSIVAHAVVNVFASAGVRDCAILLLDEGGKLSLQADARDDIREMQLSQDEEVTAVSVMMQGHIVDLYTDSTVLPAGKSMPHRFRRVIADGHPEYQYIRMIPLKLGQKVIGVVRLLIEGDARHLSVERSSASEKERLNPQTAFFWSFLDQATSVIERARLRRESLQIELLRRTDALRSALLSSVSHDLRTPLSSIKAAASSLLQEDVQWDDEERRSFATAIEREADRLNRLVGNLLDMSRIEGGALKPEKELYPVDELIHDVLGHMQFVLQGREIKTAIPDDLPPVQLDYLQMDQVLTNLVENAVRYTPASSPIEIAVEVHADEIMISIGDRGPGIPPADLERIFDKFYRVIGTTRRATSTMGTGLGLAVCRGLVEAHGGHIWAENREGGGAVFRFTLPVSRSQLLSLAS